MSTEALASQAIISDMLDSLKLSPADRIHAFEMIKQYGEVMRMDGAIHGAVKAKESYPTPSYQVNDLHEAHTSLATQPS